MTYNQKQCYCGICSGWKEQDQYGYWWHTVPWNGRYERQMLESAGRR